MFFVDIASKYAKNLKLRLIGHILLPYCYLTFHFIKPLAAKEIFIIE